MPFSLSNAFSLLLGAASLVLTCDLHQHIQRAPIDTLRGPHVRRSDLGEYLDRRAAGPRDWEYKHSEYWGDIKPEYAACKNGTQQSPIDFLPSHGLSKLHKPSFHNYDRNVTGDLFNWGFGPSFTCDTTDGITSLPTLKWDDKTAYLIGFHLHFPSEHTVNGEHHRAELHLVHADASGNPAAVLGIFIDIGEFSPSFATVPAVPGPDDTTVVHGVPLNMYMDIQEAGHFDKFWTYQGSLTTPPCKEGLRWFVSEKVQTVSREQWAGLKTLRKFSSRETQEIINQNVNL